MVLVGGNYTARDLQGQELWHHDTQKHFGLRIVDERSLHTVAGYRKFVVIQASVSSVSVTGQAAKAACIRLSLHLAAQVCPQH